MNRLRITQTALFATVLLAGPAHAQLSTLVVSPNLSPRSIVVAGTDHVICSLQQDGQQQTVNIANPATPFLQGALFNAPHFDQYCDATYTPLFGGRLVTAHRFGGINLIDASNPPVLSTLHSLIQPPKYSHEGLKIFVDGTGLGYVAYSEHNVSNTGGGLRLYQMLSNQLVPLGADIAVGRDGNALEIDPLGRYIWQFGFANNVQTDQRLNVWDTNNWTTPSLVTSIPVPNVTTYGDKDLEKAQSANLVAACGFGGIFAIDVTTPSAPVVNQVFSAANIFFDGVAFFPNTNLAMSWGWVDFGGNVYVDFMLFLDATTPGLAIPLFAVPATMRIADVKLEFVATHFAYMLGQDRITGEAKLQIW